MPIQGARESSGRKRRGVLVLSLILLVWNLCASAERVVSAMFFPSVDNVDGSSVLRSAQSPRSGPQTIRQKYLLGKRLDINTASLQEISELPGISDKVAAAVVEERDRIGRFRSPEDLLGVKGIKAKRLQKILPFLSEIHNN